MIVLGIDPALCSLGWAVIHEESAKLKYLCSGRIKTTNLDLMHKRLGSISQEIEKIIAHYQPNMIAMEITFVNTNAESSLKLGYVRGAIMALVGMKNLDYMEFRPNLIKKTVVGIGHADKNQIIHMIKLLIPGSSDVKNSDEADALAIAYTGVIYSKSVLYRAQQL